MSIVHQLYWEVLAWEDSASLPVHRICPLLCMCVRLCPIGGVSVFLSLGIVVNFKQLLWRTGTAIHTPQPIISFIVCERDAPSYECLWGSITIDGDIWNNEPVCLSLTSWYFGLHSVFKYIKCLFILDSVKFCKYFASHGHVSSIMGNYNTGKAFAS